MLSAHKSVIARANKQCMTYAQSLLQGSDPMDLNGHQQESLCWTAGMPVATACACCHRVMLTQANAASSKDQVERKGLKGVCLYELRVCKGWPHTLLCAMQDVMPRVVSHPYNLPEIAIHNSDGASETCQQQHGCSSSAVGAPFAHKELFLWLQQNHTASLM